VAAEGRRALGILLVSGTHERAHYAFVVAAAAAAIGRAVVVFATNDGCHALLDDWSGLRGSDGDAAARARGVAGLEELREAARALGVRLMACEAGLRLAAIGADALPAGVEVAGVTTFLAAVDHGQIVTL
jgi:peroxiredoxin family protein